MAKVKIEFNRDTCIGCKKCVDTCFLNVFTFDAGEKKAKPQYPEDCIWCLLCEENCPKDCIKVIPEIPYDIQKAY